MIALDVGDRAVQLALEAAPVVNVQQEVGVRGSLQSLDSRPRRRQLGPEAANGQFGAVVRDRQPGRRSARGELGRDLALRHDSFSALRPPPGGRLGFLFHGHLSTHPQKHGLGLSEVATGFATGIRATYQPRPFLMLTGLHLKCPEEACRDSPRQDSPFRTLATPCRTSGRSYTCGLCFWIPEKN